jgi:DNA-nicking Smr family endonuclease
MTRKLRKLSAEERRLWSYVTNTTVPLPGRETEPSFEELLSGPQATDAAAPAPARSGQRPAAPPAAPSGPAAWTLDGATQRRLRRGRMRPEATLDLHGMRQAEAHAALVRFVGHARARGRRCVLVITGKGLTAGRPDPDMAPFMQPQQEGGILRARLSDWLAQEPLRHQVYWAGPAHPTHGGSGAHYLLLKKPSAL